MAAREKPTPRADRHQMQERTAEVADLIVAGLTQHELHKYIREKRAEWDLERRQRSTIIRRARERVVDASKTHYAEELGKAIRRLNVLYRRSFAINDYKTCAAIVRQMADLLGLATQTSRSGEDASDVRRYLDGLRTGS